MAATATTGLGSPRIIGDVAPPIITERGTVRGERTNYDKGREAEYAARKRLQADGYHTVLRMSGSHGPADLVAVGPTHVKFVQVKRTEMGRADYSVELAALRAWPVPEPCVKELWIHDVGARRWIVLLA